VTSHQARSALSGVRAQEADSNTPLVAVSAVDEAVSPVDSVSPVASGVPVSVPVWVGTGVLGAGVGDSVPVGGLGSSGAGSP
jgi:hypothetical protein